jgi:hypothetical protein
VVVFEDASLLDVDDEPGFASNESDDEPVFIPPSQELTPVIQGLALVEEVEDPMMGAEAPAAAQEPAPAVEAPTAAEEAPAPVVDAAPTEPQAAAPAPQEDPHGEAPVPGVDEPSQQELVPPAAESADLQENATVTVGTEDLEELGVLDALNAVDETPAPAARAEAPAEQAPANESPAEQEPSTSEPAPGLALPFGEREKVWAKPATSSTRSRSLPEWSLSGDLKNTSIPRLLNAYYEALHSGELKLKQGSVQKVVYFEAGRPVYAASNLAHERFARFCVRRGAVPEAKLQEVLTLAREQNLRSGEAMIRLGLMDAQLRQQLVVEQVKEILWSTFSWTEGAYGFSPMRPPRAGLVKLSIFPGDLILEGILKTEPLVTLRQRMPRSRRLFPSAAPPYGLHELKLKGQQALLLAYADGTKTVEDLLTLTDLPERDVLATLRGLELIGVLEERRDEPTNRSRISFGL